MKKESKITDLLALMVLLVFSVCVMLVLITGTRVYSRLLENGEAGFEHRTGVRYITTRVKQARSVSVEEFEGLSALVIPEEVDGEIYNTMVYWYDGCIFELYCAEGAGLYPEDGEKVIESEMISFSEENGMLTAKIGSDEIYLEIARKEIPL